MQRHKTTQRSSARHNKEAKQHRSNIAQRAEPTIVAACVCLVLRSRVCVLACLLCVVRAFRFLRERDCAARRVGGCQRLAKRLYRCTATWCSAVRSPHKRQATQRRDLEKVLRFLRNGVYMAWTCLSHKRDWLLRQSNHATARSRQFWCWQRSSEMAQKN